MYQSNIHMYVHVYIYYLYVYILQCRDGLLGPCHMGETISQQLRAKPLSMAAKCETKHLHIFEPPSGDKHGRFEDLMISKTKV